MVRPRLLDAVVVLLLSGLTLAAFGELLWGGPFAFVNFDDYDYIVDNPHVSEGLTWPNLRWAFFSFHHYNWHPLTWLSLQLDCQLFGLAPRGFHAVNVALHTVNALLLYWLLRGATGAVWRAAAVAALFAVHPLRVESVAWITERKDVLSTFFFLAALLAYVRYAAGPSVDRFAGVALALVLGLMSKPMVITLPCVLLLLDYWPLGRWPGGPPAAFADGPRARTPPAWLVVEKLPLLLLSAASGLLTYLAAGEGIGDIHRDISLDLRLLNAIVSYGVYLGQMAWPHPLAAVYLYRDATELRTMALLVGPLLAAMTVAIWWLRRRAPYLLVGWLWYLGTLVPVLGLLQVAQHAHADRFTYIPMIGVLIAVAWGAEACLGRHWLGRAVLGTGLAGCLGGWIATTASQVAHWRDSEALWDRAVAVSGNDPRLHQIAAGMFLRSRQFEAARRHALAMRDRAPDNPDSHQLVAMTYIHEGRAAEALPSMMREAELRTDSTRVRQAIVRLLYGLGRIPEGMEQWALLANLAPQSADGLAYQGMIAHQRGDPAAAVGFFREAARLAPADALFHADLALALHDAGDDDAAARALGDALAANPQWPDVCGSYAWLLATHPEARRRHGPEALRRARQACLATHERHPRFLAALAAAQAECGRFDDAVQTAEQAMKIARDAGDLAMVRRLDEMLSHYRKGCPYRDKPK
ncbi:MAG: hypothetical protein NZO58_10900 [Gemmataceae bacterium]|nr:hypothetical protein [Gemmataceae bacterium]